MPWNWKVHSGWGFLQVIAITAETSHGGAIWIHRSWLCIFSFTVLKWVKEIVRSENLNHMLYKARVRGSDESNPGVSTSQGERTPERVCLHLSSQSHCPPMWGHISGANCLFPLGLYVLRNRVPCYGGVTNDIYEKPLTPRPLHSYFRNSRAGIKAAASASWMR